MTVRDTVGAGDAFTAVLAAALTARATPPWPAVLADALGWLPTWHRVPARRRHTTPPVWAWCSALKKPPPDDGHRRHDRHRHLFDRNWNLPDFG